MKLWNWSNEKLKLEKQNHNESLSISIGLIHDSRWNSSAGERLLRVDLQDVLIVGIPPADVNLYPSHQREHPSDTLTQSHVTSNPINRHRTGTLSARYEKM